MKVNQSMLLFALAGLVIGGALGYWYGTRQIEEEYLSKNLLLECSGLEGDEFLHCIGVFGTGGGAVGSGSSPMQGK